MGYSYFRGRFKKLDGSQDDRDNESPDNKISIRSSFDITDKLALDIWYRYTDRILSLEGSEIPDYSSLDVRLGYRPIKSLEFSIVGRNLIEKHVEFRPTFVGSGTNSELDRHFYIKVSYQF